MRPPSGSVPGSLDRLFNLGIRLPVVAIDFEPSPARVVQAVKNEAIDYLVLPLKPMRLAACISRIMKEAAEASEGHLEALGARQRLSKPSGRELQVLEALTAGGSNMEIARRFEVSPLTVEIHRATLMGKLGRRHAADAVRVKVDASPEIPLASEC